MSKNHIYGLSGGEIANIIIRGRWPHIVVEVAVRLTSRSREHFQRSGLLLWEMLKCEESVHSATRMPSPTWQSSTELGRLTNTDGAACDPARTRLPGVRAAFLPVGLGGQ